MNKKGFTLIELLVVVLIIGILSSVALPQYTKAVEKSRMAGVWSVLGSIRKAAAVALMEGETYDSNGVYNTNPINLDATVNCTGASGQVCWLDCPASAWRDCAYKITGTPENPKAWFVLHDKGNGSNFAEMLVDNSGQSCYGTMCSKFGISAKSSSKQNDGGQYW